MTTTLQDVRQRRAPVQGERFLVMKEFELGATPQAVVRAGKYSASQSSVYRWYGIYKRIRSHLAEIGGDSGRAA
ncbi:MAG: hypothetical protein AAGJ95_13970 [Cyanobacteria bacterium J06554_11]